MNAPQAPAREVKAAAAHWFERRTFWPTTAEDEASFADWLNASLAHRAAYVRVEAAWQRGARLGILKPTVRPQAAPPPRQKFPLWFAAIGVAATLVVAVIATNPFAPTAESDIQTFATAIGGHETLALSDGTRIELNTNTQLRTRITATERKVWLDRGEAYFKVTHNAKRPFVVIAGNHKVTDLGTTFYVQRASANIRVGLVEGLAQVDALNTKANVPSVQMVPGDVVIASANRIETEKRPKEALAADLGWRSGQLVFKSTTLAEAAEQFNRYNREKLVIAPAAAPLKIGGTFKSNNIADFAEVARVVLGVRIQHKADQTIISR